MSTMTYLEAIGLNNNAVTLFEQGLIYQAYEVLSNSRLCLVEEDERSPQEQPCHCKLSVEGKTNQCSYGYQWVDFKQHKPVSTRYPLTSKSNNACLPFPCLPFLCLYAVKIIYSVNAMPNEKDCDCSIRWVVLHNLALANHLMGSRLGERGRFMIEQAHQCYTLARLTVPTETCSHDVFKLLLSTQNNQMSIYVEFGMHEQSKACLKVLMEMMSSLPQYAEGMDLDHEIVLNVMVLSQTDTSAAA